MIHPDCFTKAWLNSCREQAGRLDPALLEKSIYAFDLLGRLQAAGLPFVFKGGTAMLLLLDQFRRLSIDVDIVCPLPEEEVERVVTEVAAKGPYLSMEPDKRDPNRLPRRHHYLFRYRSVVNDNIPQLLQLDVLQDEAHYPVIQNRPLTSRFIRPLGEVSVPVPTIEGLLGDKLTAFAPETVGVRYTAFKAPMRIAKQISDIGELFVHAQDSRAVLHAYNALFEAENRYRAGAFTREQALLDTIAAARILASVQLKGSKESEASRLLHEGVGQVDSHMIGKTYRLDDAKVAASRAAHLAAMVLRGAVGQLHMERYDPARVAELKQATLSLKWHPLMRLRGINDEAFYHWSRVQALIDE